MIYALAKHENKEWDAEAVRQAIIPESLSLAADAATRYNRLAAKIGTIFRLVRQIRETLSPEVEFH